MDLPIRISNTGSFPILGVLGGILLYLFKFKQSIL